MLVVDASAVVEVLLRRPAADEIERAFATHAYDLHAPELVDVEVVSALRRVVASGDATSERAGAAVDDLLDLPIERYPHRILISRVWALRASVSAYDAAYVALAEALVDAGAALITADRRLARAATAHAWVPVVGIA